MESNDKERSNFGVACSLSRLPGGRIQLVLDDIKNVTESTELWRHDAFVTSKEYEQAQLFALDLPEEELAALGYYVLARLLAANGLLVS